MTTLWSDDPALIKAQLAQQVRDAEDRAKKAQVFASEVEGYRAEGRDRRREVVAVVDAAGRLLDLRLKEAVSESSSNDIAQAVLEAYRDATARAAADLIRRAAAVFGENSPTTQALTDDFTRHLGASEEA
ncbi:MAG: YbaB/EbfC family nucleoid-associated protein [Propionibacteriaceae bacterium]|nr:YbaB/EbfC family nucleoid-associated protein [Micropruina sp.]HBX82304.1 hypothetical protein [Propionibacteriaceae bacterium]HBY22808.1 hypothetical protein [Propionibacteriaceae bacterium]